MIRALVETIEKCNINGRRFFKKCAKKLLYNDWIFQILAFLIVGGCVSGINQFGTSVYAVLYFVTENQMFAKLFLAVYSLVCLFGVCVPLFYGVVNFERNAAVKEKSDLRDLFYYFSSFELLSRAYYVFFNVALRIILCYLPALILIYLKEFFYFEGFFGFIMRYGTIDLVGTALRTLVVILLYLGFVFSAKYYLTLFLSIEKRDFDMSKLLMMTKMCLFGERVKIAALALSFLPLFVVSLFTMGFLFIIYTLPYMFLTLTVYCKYVYERELYTKSSSSLIENKSLEN